MKNIFFAIIVLCALSCCRENGEIPRLQFAMTVSDSCHVIYPDTVNVSITDNYINNLYLSRYGYVISNDKIGAIVTVLDTLTLDLKYKFGMKGRGPNEFISPILVSVDYDKDWVYINDLAKGELSRIVLTEDEAYMDPAYKTGPFFTGRICALDTLCISFSDIQDTPELLLMSSSGLVRKEYIHHLVDDKKIKTPSYFTYRSSIKICRKNHLLIAAGLMIPVVMAYSVERDELIPRWRLFLEPEPYEIEKGFPLPKKELKWEIIRTYLSADFIYVSVKKKGTPDGYTYLLKLDYTGKCMNTYKIACDFYSFLISRDESALLGIAGDMDGCLVRVKL